MKATFSDRPQKFRTSHRKETACHLTQWSVVDLAAKPYAPTAPMPEVVTLRVYVTPAGAVTAAVWIHPSKGEHRSGTGSASGGGYCRKSAAAAYAIQAAGVDLSAPIDGRGEGMIREVVLAIAKAAGARRPAIVQAYA